MLSTKDTLKVFKYYMKQYFVKPEKGVYEAFQSEFTKDYKVMYCQGERFFLLQCGLAFLDYKENYKQHTQIISYDLLNGFLHLDEDTSHSQIFYDFPSSPLIIYHPTATTDNARLFSLITHTYSYRNLEGSQTLILSESNILQDIMDKVTPIHNISYICERSMDIYD